MTSVNYNNNILEMMKKLVPQGKSIRLNNLPNNEKIAIMRLMQYFPEWHVQVFRADAIIRLCPSENIDSTVKRYMDIEARNPSFVVETINEFKEIVEKIRNDYQEQLDQELIESINNTDGILVVDKNYLPLSGNVQNYLTEHGLGAFVRGGDERTVIRKTNN